MGWVLPSFSGLFSTAASHGGKSLASAAGLVGAGFAVGVGGGDALDNIASDTTCHSQTIAHGWQFWFSVVCSNGLGDVISPFIGVDNFGVFQRLALSLQAVGGSQCMAESRFVPGCSVLVDPDDPDAVDDPRRRRSQLGCSRQLCFQFLEGLGCFSGGLGGVDAVASAGVLLWLPSLFSGTVGVHGSHLVDEVSEANNLGMLAVPMIRGWVIGTVQRPPGELVGKGSVATQQMVEFCGG